MQDASNNRVEQWLGASIAMGVYVGELQLGSTPVLGNWKITVNVDNEVLFPATIYYSCLWWTSSNFLFLQSAEKIFEVDEYVLPKFEVTAIAPKDSTYADGTLKITAKAMYTYGQPVKGVALFVITRNYYWDSTPQTPIAQKQINIDGTAIAEFDMASELKISENNWQDDFKVTITVTEGLTG